MAPFSFITPNMISIFHLCVGFMAGKFMSSSDLMDRRIGVAVYFFRTWLDAFDGTVHRLVFQGTVFSICPLGLMEDIVC